MRRDYQEPELNSRERRHSLDTLNRGTRSLDTLRPANASYSLSSNSA